MALKLYGVVDSVSGVEFLIRARSDKKAAETVVELQNDLNAITAFSILVGHTGPFKIQTSLVASRFEVNGHVNGIST